eukprot:UN18369
MGDQIENVVEESKSEITQKLEEETARSVLRLESGMLRIPSSPSRRTESVSPIGKERKSQLHGQYPNSS